MRNFICLSIISIALFIASCGFQQYQEPSRFKTDPRYIPGEDIPISAEPGKCYAQTKVDQGASKTIWVEVICEKELDTKVITAINNKLIELDYLDADNKQISNYSVNQVTKSALYNYQKAHNFPVGNFNIETLEHLGVL